MLGIHLLRENKKSLSSLFFLIFIGIAFSHTASAAPILSWSDPVTIGENTVGIATASSGPIYATQSSTKKYNLSGPPAVATWATEGVDVVVDQASGEVIIAGTSGVSGSYNITKHTSAGSIVWNRSFNGGAFAFAKRVATDNQRNIYIAGYDASSTFGVNRWRVIKYDSVGTLQWGVTYDHTGGGGTNDEAIGIAADNQNPAWIYVVGRVSDVPTEKGYIIRFNSTNGAIVWKRLYDTGSNGQPLQAVAADANNDVYFTGSNIPGSTLNIFTFKLAGTTASTSAPIWSDSVDSATGLSADIGFDITVKGSFVYVTGGLRLYEATQSAMTTLKYNASSGNKLWQVNYPLASGGAYYGTSLDIASDNGVVVTGLYKTVKYVNACTGPLTFGSWSTPTSTVGSSPKLTDITDLRTRIDTLRTDAGLGAFIWTDSPLTAGIGVRAVHINDLRQATEDIYTACGQTLPSWTDGSRVIAGGTPMRVQHINELRTAVSGAF